MNRVVTYNLGENFLSCITNFIEENYLKKGKAIDNLAFVFGGKRPGLFLKRELAKRFGKGFIAPKIFSMDEFVEYILAKKLSLKKISHLDGAYIIYETAKRIAPEILQKRENFSQFLPWAEEMISFFEQLDLEKVEDLALRNIGIKASIGYDVPEDVNRLLESMLNLREAYTDYLRKENLYSRGRIYSLTAKEIAEIDLSEFENIFFCGLFYLHKTELEIIKNLYLRGKAILFFQGDMEEWQSLKRVAQELSIQIKPEKNHHPSFALYIQAGFDLHSEIGLVREIIKKIEDLGNTAIVLPEPSVLIPLLSELTAFVKDYNVSLGYPLRRSALYSLFQNIFKAQQTRKEDFYYTPDYLKLINHPLVKNLSLEGEATFTRILLHKIEEIICGEESSSLGGSLFVKLSEIHNCAPIYEGAIETIKGLGISFDWYRLRKMLKEIHRIFFHSWEEFNSFQDFSFFLEEFINFMLKYSSLEKYPLNLKMAERILGIAEELQNAKFKEVHFPVGEIFNIFQQRLENEYISFSGSPLRGLQILGLLETRALNFKNVLVMDVNEAVLPKLSIYEPLIPREILINLGINRLEKEEEIQRYHFKRIISSAENVFLIYQRREDREKSRFIEELIWERQKKFKSWEVISIPQASFKISVLPKKTEIKKNNDILEYLKRMEYSSSSLNTYLHCPLRFYYQYVLGLQEREDVFDGPEGQDIGRFIHELLAETFSRFIGKKFFIDEKFEEYFLKVLEKRFAEEFRNRRKADAFLIEEVVKFRMEHFLREEAERGVEEIICLEKTFKGKIEFCGSNFRFQAIVDRLDRLSDGTFLILDYKTGGGEIKPQSGEKIMSLGFERKALKKTIKSFQLPLYIYLLNSKKEYKRERLNAGLYYLRDLSRKPGISLLLNDEEMEDKEKIMQIYRKAIGSLLNEILNPKIPFQADEDDVYQCQSCPFSALCR
ncbi:MAG: PD-(D/E)XK nuclease family protein [Candidatus Omnitrophica bacterium]|nr:PD-(D/E)XK nuclease family protein [Candidatus Omnitrophota bacterium]